MPAQESFSQGSHSAQGSHSSVAAQESRSCMPAQGSRSNGVSATDDSYYCNVNTRAVNTRSGTLD